MGDQSHPGLEPESDFALVRMAMCASFDEQRHRRSRMGWDGPGNLATPGRLLSAVGSRSGRMYYMYYVPCTSYTHGHTMDTMDPRYISIQVGVMHIHEIRESSHRLRALRANRLVRCRRRPAGPVILPLCIGMFTPLCPPPLPACRPISAPILLPGSNTLGPRQQTVVVNTGDAGIKLARCVLSFFGGFASTLHAMPLDLRPCLRLRLCVRFQSFLMCVFPAPCPIVRLRSRTNVRLYVPGSVRYGGRLQWRGRRRRTAVHSMSLGGRAAEPLIWAFYYDGYVVRLSCTRR